MKKYLIILLTVLSISSIVKQSNAAEPCIPPNLNGYDLYEKRVECTCEPYKPEKSIANIEKYLIIDKDKAYFENDFILSFTGEVEREILKEKQNSKVTESEFLDKNNYIKLTSNIYKENMNNIYKCALLETQITSLENINNTLINDNITLKKKLEKKIQNKVDTLKKFKSKKCIEAKNNESDALIKLRVLRQTTYETCSYHSYLEYLKEYYSNINNLLSNEVNNETMEHYNINQITTGLEDKNQQINEEIERAYKVFPLAFDAYSQYEDNIQIHLLLELLKEDYITYRKKLHQTINPINQVVYKIANAMKK